MAESITYRISSKAYSKIILHALKYRANAVNGILIGKSSSDNDKPESVEIVDSVPLCHGQIGLLPTFEIALNLVEELLASKKEGLGVVGYYHSNERYDDFELGSLAKKIGDHIARYFPQASIFMLDNKLLEELPSGKSKKPVAQLYTRDSSKVWRLAGSSGNGATQLAFEDSASNTVVWGYISDRKEQQLVDFDDHLDDISKDWMNKHLF